LFTVNQHPVDKRIHGPNVWCPISVAQSPGEREQTTKNLVELTPPREWAKGRCEHCNDADSQLDAVEKLDVEVRKRRPVPEAIGAQKIDKIRGCEIQVDVLQAQEGSKEQTRQQERRVITCKDHGQYQDTVEKAIVLEMDVVDD
jgi:hypothetical protein